MQDYQAELDFFGHSIDDVLLSRVHDSLNQGKATIAEGLMLYHLTSTTDKAKARAGLQTQVNKVDKDPTLAKLCLSALLERARSQTRFSIGAQTSEGSAGATDGAAKQG